jgi:hypothetical protein
MDNTNFWLRNQPVAYAVVNGLIGSMSLWGFWTPFITFLAQPVASAVMKQDICNALNGLQTPTVLPNYSKNAGYKLIDQDPGYLQSLNQSTIVSLWLLAGLSITISLWATLSIIQQGQLDINHIVTLNLVLFVCIISIELAFFVGVGLKFIPFNLRDLYDDIIKNLVGQLGNYTT